MLFKWFFKGGVLATTEACSSSASLGAKYYNEVNSRAPLHGLISLPDILLLLQHFSPDQGFLSWKFADPGVSFKRGLMTHSFFREIRRSRVFFQRGKKIQGFLSWKLADPTKFFQGGSNF
jgi:hypothetical protein